MSASNTSKRGAAAVLGPIHVGVEYLEAGAAALLGPVHGGVRVAQEALGPVAGRAGHGHPDARGHVALATGDRERLAEGLLHALRDLERLLLVHHVLAKKNELVAAEARDGVARSKRFAEARRECAEQLVAGLVAEAVVDHLEVVHVEKEHGQGGVAAPRAGKRVL